MKIKKIGDKSLEISNAKSKILAFPESLKDSKVKDIAPEIILNQSLEGSFAVTSPGEYESNEIWVMAMPSDVKEYEITDVFVINIDEVRIALIGKTAKSLSKKQIEKIGIIDILVLDLDIEDIKPYSELVSNIDPQIIVPVGGDADKVDALIKKLGIKSTSEESKLKAKMEDFSNEDFQLQVVLL